MWKVESNDRIDPATGAANVHLQTRGHRRILEIERSRNRKTQ